MSDLAPDADDRDVEATGPEPGPLPEDERPVDPPAADPGPVPEDERVVPGGDGDDAADSWSA